MGYIWTLNDYTGHSNEKCVKKSAQSVLETATAKSALKSTKKRLEEGFSQGSVLSPRCEGAAARRAGLSPLLCDAPIYRLPVDRKLPLRRPGQKLKCWGVAGGTIERSCYSPYYVNTERDYEGDYQAALPQGRTAADGCKHRHGRDDRKRERSFSGLRAPPRASGRAVLFPSAWRFSA